MRRFRQLAKLVLTLAVIASNLGCASPAAPDSPEPSPALSPDRGGAALSSETPDVTFQLLDGSFRLMGAGGDFMTGTYAGVASVGRLATSTSEFKITGGTGAFSGAVGTLSGNGKGAFTGEGRFSLTLAGRVTTQSSGGVKLRLALEGTATVSCTASNQISVTQNGTGSAPRVGIVSGTFQHHLSDTRCTS
jgi:hypothetical protein